MVVEPKLANRKIKMEIAPKKAFVKPNLTLSRSLSIAVLVGKLTGCIPFRTGSPASSNFWGAALNSLYVAILAVWQVSVFLLMQVFVISASFSLHDKVSD